MLKIDDLWYSYGKISALRGINFEVKRGEIMAIVGANGAGKSTLMKCLSGLLKPQKGTILYHDKELLPMPHLVVRNKMVLIPEGRWIFPNLTVEENLRIGAYTVKEYAENMERSYEMFPRLGERRKQRAGTLSGGEQQMLAIARGLMSNPETVLLDEPSLGLAPLIVNDVMDVVKAINEKGITVLIVEQNAKKALSIADHACVIEQGRVAKSGTGRELAQDESIIQSYLGGKRREARHD